MVVFSYRLPRSWSTIRIPCQKGSGHTEEDRRVFCFASQTKGLWTRLYMHVKRHPVRSSSQPRIRTECQTKHPSKWGSQRSPRHRRREKDKNHGMPLDLILQDKIKSLGTTVNVCLFLFWDQSRTTKPTSPIKQKNRSLTPFQTPKGSKRLENDRQKDSGNPKT